MPDRAAHWLDRNDDRSTMTHPHPSQLNPTLYAAAADPLTTQLVVTIAVAGLVQCAGYMSLVIPVWDAAFASGDIASLGW